MIRTRMRIWKRAGRPGSVGKPDSLTLGRESTSPPEAAITRGIHRSGKCQAGHRELTPGNGELHVSIAAATSSASVRAGLKPPRRQLTRILFEQPPRQQPPTMAKVRAIYALTSSSLKGVLVL